MSLKKIAAAAAAALLVGQWALRQAGEEPPATPPAAQSPAFPSVASPAPATATGARPLQTSHEDAAAAAFARRDDGVVITVDGRVDRILADDHDGSRHQRFILRTFSGHTVLVAHNIDLAPRLQGLKIGERLALRGEYEWNDRGGVIHWTHRDPKGMHPGGYIEREGRRYQ